MLNKKEKLTETFHELLPKDNTSLEDTDPDHHPLRSGSSHPCIPPIPSGSDNAVATPPLISSNRDTMNPGGASARAAVPLKVIPYKHDVKKFSSSNPNYSVLDFPEPCEDAFLSMQVKEPKEKIGFI